MITEDYVSFDTAKFLKEKGFDWEVHRSYLVNDNVFIPGDINDVSLRKDVIRIPTLQMAMKWLREKYNWHIEICRGPKGYHIWIVTIPLGVTKYITEEVCGKGIKYLDTYEEACEAGIRYCLKNLI